MENSSQKIILILCTGNSCRSQMAQAILNHELSSQIRAISAGVQPKSQVSPNAIKALELIGIQTHDLFPKTIDDVIHENIDLVITVCDNAKEVCPIFPKNIQKIHISFPDPDEKSLDDFIEVRNDIKNKLIPIIKDYLK